MLVLDWILLALMAFGAVKGWRRGFVRQILSLVAFFVGLLVAKACYTMLGGVLSPYLNDHTTVANIVAFILIWIAVPGCLALVGEMISTVLDKLFVLGTLNSFLGALIGLFKYELILGAFIWVFSLTQILSPATMEESVLCKPLKAVAETVYSLMVGSEE